MREATRILVFGFLALFCVLGMAVAQKPKPDASGRIGAPAPQAAAAAAAPTKACLQLHYSGGGTVFNFDLTIDPTSFPYKVTGGKITGSICGSPNWKVTGGSLGGSLTITGVGSPPSPGCATKIDVKGTSNPQPPSWGGTYGFDGVSTSFKHQTLFLGYNKPTCP